MYQKINTCIKKLFLRVDDNDEGYVTKYLPLFRAGHQIWPPLY